MNILNLFKKEKGDTKAVLDLVFEIKRKKDLQTYYIYDTDKNSKSIKALFKASSGLNYAYDSTTHYLGKLSNNGLVKATIDGINYYDIGTIRKSVSVVPDNVLVLVTKPDKGHSNNKSGYNFYLKY